MTTHASALLLGLLGSLHPETLMLVTAFTIAVLAWREVLAAAPQPQPMRRRVVPARAG